MDYNNLFYMMQTLNDALETLYYACNHFTCPTCPMNPALEGLAEKRKYPSDHGRPCPVKALERYFPGGPRGEYTSDKLPNVLKNCSLCTWFREEKTGPNPWDIKYYCGNPKHTHFLREVTTAWAWCSDWEEK